MSGECDTDDRIFPYEYDHFKEASASGKFNLINPGPGIETAFIWFNENTNVDSTTGKPYVDPVKSKWFRNEKFRQAISYALDRDSILQSVYSGRGFPNYGFITPGNKVWYNPNTPKYPHDLNQAIALLKEIGIEKRNGDNFLTDENGHKIEFTLNTNVGNGAREKTAVLIKADLEKLGIKSDFSAD